MSFSERLLGKPLRSLTYKDVDDYFKTARTESDLMEFKSFSPRSKPEERWKGICKGVCAMLNSTGGILIWGAPLETAAPGKRGGLYQGELTDIDPSFDKDMIVSRISSSVIPLASGFQVQVLESGNGQRVCVIEVESSFYGPHQCEDKYYMRLDGQSRPAPHHYIEALFKRVTYPNLYGYLHFGSINTEPGRTPGTTAPVSVIGFEVTFYIWNLSKMQNEEAVFFTLSSDHATVADWRDRPNANIATMGNGRIVSKADAVSVLSYGTPYYYIERFQVEPNVLSSLNNKLEFSLDFGGKKSPTKTCKYRLDFTKSVGNQSDLSWLEIVSENVLSYEDLDEKGITMEDIIRKIRGPKLP